MIEVVPKDPFKQEEVNRIEKSIEGLYKFIADKVGKDTILSTSSFPMLGVENFYYEKFKYVMDEDRIYDVYENPFSKSQFFKDVCINTHPRFGYISSHPRCLTRNIRQRKGDKVCILIPIYQDEKTNLTVKTLDEPYPGNIYMDAMGFGMGSSCFQITVGVCSLEQSCYIYDQFIPLAPILLALTASSPFFKGKLSGQDVRFDVISQSVDDRTPDERDPKSKKFIHKSRFGPAYSYISENKLIQDFHNDYPKFPINEEYFKLLIANGIFKFTKKFLVDWLPIFVIYLSGIRL
jgi:glutamate--cysteine ligase catalytic subunit